LGPLRSREPISPCWYLLPRARLLAERNSLVLHFSSDVFNRPRCVFEGWGGVFTWAKKWDLYGKKAFCGVMPWGKKGSKT